jgi:hypothetical protein
MEPGNKCQDDNIAHFLAASCVLSWRSLLSSRKLFGAPKELIMGLRKGVPASFLLASLGRQPGRI